MAERAAVFQNVQIGVETTPGTAVAAGKRLQAMGIRGATQMETSRFRPMGQKWLAIVAPGLEWVEASLDGFGTYNELIYGFSSVLDAATISTPVDATLARQWLFNPSSTGPDAPKTFTVEQGDTSIAHRFAHGIITELGLAFSRSGNVEISGSMLARALEHGITLTAAPTTLAPIPILGKQVSVYMDAASADFGTTKLVRVLSAEFNVSDRYAPLWALDAAQTSFAAVVEGEEPSATLALVMEADAAGIGVYTPMRAGDTRFLRIQCIGPLIEGTIFHEFTIDFAGKVTEVSEFGSEDGVYTVGYTFEAVHDATWGSAMEVRIVNTLTAL
jgi:hypothetical protein